MKKDRAGSVIIGAGLMGRWHAHSIRAIGGKVTAVFDRDLLRAESLAKRYKAVATTSLEGAFASNPLAVHICTPRDSHVTLASASLDHGAHVLMEKPFAPTAADTSLLLDQAAGANLIVCPVHQFLFQPGTTAAVNRASAFGPLLHVDFVACTAGADHAPDTRDRLVLDILPHSLSVIRRILGSSLSSAQWLADSPAAGEVRITGSFDGVTVGILISAAGRPTRNTARLIGIRGTMHLDFFHGFGMLEPPEVSRTRKMARPFTVGLSTFAGATANLASRAFRNEPAYPGLRDLVRQFYGRIETGEMAPISPDEVLDVARASEVLSSLLTEKRGADRS